jgi:hypothetical protein
MTVSIVVASDGLSVTTVNTNDITGSTVTIIFYTVTSNIETTVRDASGDVVSITTDTEDSVTGNLITSTTYTSSSDYATTTTDSSGNLVNMTFRVTDITTGYYTVTTEDFVSDTQIIEAFDASGSSISTTTTTVDAVNSETTSIVVFSDTNVTLTDTVDASGNALTVTSVIGDSVTGAESSTTIYSGEQKTTTTTTDSSGNNLGESTVDMSNSSSGTISTSSVVYSTVDGTTSTSTLVTNITGDTPETVSSTVTVVNTATSALISSVVVTYDASGNFTTVTTDAEGAVTSAFNTAPIYAFYASGGFALREGFNTIEANLQVGINAYDFTNAVQLSFNTQTFNQKLGIFKDADNITLLEDASKTGIYATRYYDASSDIFIDSSTGTDVSFNSISLQSLELKSGVSLSSQVVSVGALESLYVDFVASVRAYFGYAGGFASLFENAETFDVSGGTSFSGATLMELLDLSDLSGTIIISSVVESLRHVVDSNIFNNRSGLGTSTDITNRNNYGVGDGFMPGDMIWIPSGIQVNLTVNVDAELVDTFVNNIGPLQEASSTESYLQDGALFSDVLTTSLTNISKTMTVPLVLVLSDDV